MNDFQHQKMIDDGDARTDAINARYYYYMREYLGAGSVTIDGDKYATSGLLDAAGMDYAALLDGITCQILTGTASRKTMLDTINELASEAVMKLAELEYDADIKRSGDNNGQ